MVQWHVELCSTYPSRYTEVACPSCAHERCVYGSAAAPSLNCPFKHAPAPPPGRRLFANRGSEHMDLRKKISGAPPSKRRLRNATDDDR